VYPDQPLRRQKHPRVDRRIRLAVQPGNQLVNAFLLGDGFTTHQGFSFKLPSPMFCEIVLNSLAQLRREAGLRNILVWYGYSHSCFILSTRDICKVLSAAN